MKKKLNKPKVVSPWDVYSSSEDYGSYMVQEAFDEIHHPCTTSEEVDVKYRRKISAVPLLLDACIQLTALANIKPANYAGSRGTGVAYILNAARENAFRAGVRAIELATGQKYKTPTRKTK